MHTRNLSEELKSLTPEITRPLTDQEIAQALKDIESLRRCRDFSSAIDIFLAAYQQGGVFWKWGIDHFENTPGQHGYSYGWWIVRGDDIVASLCHSFS